MPMPAARVGDMHVCPMVTGIVPHVGGPILPPGAITVLIGGMPAARVADMAVCVGPPDVIALGSFTVLIGGMPAARLGRYDRSRRRDRPRLPDRLDFMNRRKCDAWENPSEDNTDGYRRLDRATGGWRAHVR